MKIGAHQSGTSTCQHVGSTYKNTTYKPQFLVTVHSSFTSAEVSTIENGMHAMAGGVVRPKTETV